MPEPVAEKMRDTNHHLGSLAPQQGIYYLLRPSRFSLNFAD
jgi:hypothetical protein